MDKEQEYYYWKGYYEGMFRSLEHNILLMKSQLKTNKEYYKATQQEHKK